MLWSDFRSFRNFGSLCPIKSIVIASEERAKQPRRYTWRTCIAHKYGATRLPRCARN